MARLLAGGNPQIAKGDGDAPVQAYIAAIPGWKRDIGQWLDELVTRTVPGVQKAVRWNSPMYGLPGQGWFASFHVFTQARARKRLDLYARRSNRPKRGGRSGSIWTRLTGRRR